MGLGEDLGDGFADAAVLWGEGLVEIVVRRQIKDILHRSQWRLWGGTYLQTSRFLYVSR